MEKGIEKSGVRVLNHHHSLYRYNTYVGSRKMNRTLRPPKDASTLRLIGPHVAT